MMLRMRATESDAGFQRDGRRQQRANPHVALLQLRQELRAEPEAEDRAHREEAQAACAGYEIATNAERQHDLVDAADVPDHERLDLVDPVGQQDRRQHRRHGERGDDGAQKRVGIGARHGAEDLAFHALHGEEREEGGDRYDDGEEDRLVDLHRGGEDAVELVRQSGLAVRRRLRCVPRKMTEDVLHHDDGGIDDDAEIDGADGQEIGGFPAQHRDDDGQEERDRDGRRDDEGAAQIAQEYPLDQKDQRDAEKHIVQHGLHGDGHEIAAVVERHDLDAGRQAAVAVDALDRRRNPPHDIHRALEFLHQDDAGNDVGLVVAPGDPQARGETDLHLGHVRQKDRHAALLQQDDVADVLERGHDAKAAHVDRLLAHGDGAAADVGVAGRDGGDHLRQRQAIGHQAIEVDLGLKLLGLAAEHDHVGNPRDDAQLALHHPVLQRLELHHVHLRRTAQLVAHDFADAAGRRDDRLHALGQGGAGQPIDRLLAHEIVVAAVLELQANEGQPVDRVGPDEAQPRRAGNGDLDRDRDVALHLLGRLARVLRDDLDDGRRGVGVGLDVQDGERSVAERQEGREADEDQRPARQAERDQVAQHRCISP